jgi:hypothetical protein
MVDVGMKCAVVGGKVSFELDVSAFPVMQDYFDPKENRKEDHEVLIFWAV